MKMKEMDLVCRVMVPEETNECDMKGCFVLENGIIVFGQTLQCSEPEQKPVIVTIPVQVEVPPGFNWVAVDKSGEICAYREKPCVFSEIAFDVSEDIDDVESDDFFRIEQIENFESTITEVRR